MFLRKAYDFIYNHNIWNKVAATLIAAAILGVIAWIASLLKNVSFYGSMGPFLNYKIPVWICLLAIGLVVTFYYIRKGYKERKRGASVKAATGDILPPSEQAMPAKAITSSPRQTSLPDNMVFDSNSSDEFSWKGYGQQLWNKKTRILVGETGKGDYHFRRQTLTIARDNTAGRYIIEIKRYLTDPVGFVPQDLYGKAYRDFRLKFDARAPSGGIHTIKVIFRKPDSYDRFAEPEFLIKNHEWGTYVSGIAIPCDQDFIINIETTTDRAATRLMIKNFSVEEAPFKQIIPGF